MFDASRKQQVTFLSFSTENPLLCNIHHPQVKPVKAERSIRYKSMVFYYSYACAEYSFSVFPTLDRRYERDRGISVKRIDANDAWLSLSFPFALRH